MSRANTSAMTSSGSRTNTTSSAAAVVSPTTSKPSARALSAYESSRLPIRTLRPESRRLSAAVRPMWPYPRTATDSPASDPVSASLCARWMMTADADSTMDLLRDSLGDVSTQRIDGVTGVDAERCRRRHVLGVERGLTVHRALASDPGAANRCVFTTWPYMVSPTCTWHAMHRFVPSATGTG